MSLLFIDANIFLGFYNSNQPEFKKLLKTIVGLKDKIFFTEQISSEINRNKLNVFRQTFQSYIHQTSLTYTLLPEHLDAEDLPKLSAWNIERKEIESKIKSSNTLLQDIFHDMLKSIEASSDKVSTELAILHKNSIKSTSNDMERARLRKSLGNPPGKTSDPLGDQLSWEMLLNVIPKISQLWIVTKDSDYFTENNGRLYLNPFLVQDLRLINNSIEYKVFNRLSEALIDLGKSEKVEALPNKTDLEDISKREIMSDSQYDDEYRPIQFTYNAVRCPKCKHQVNARPLYKVDQNGNYTFQLRCETCLHRFTYAEALKI